VTSPSPSTCRPARRGPQASFSITAKPTSDFSGDGDEFTLAAGSDLLVDTIGACSLAWVDQPGDAERSARITSVDFAPGSAPVAVEVRDGSGGSRATSSTVPVRLRATSTSLPLVALGGTTTATAVAGLASFGPGPSLGVSSPGYRLVATTTAFAGSAASAFFVVVDDVVDCPAGQACAAPASSTRNGQTVTADFGSGSSSFDLVVSIGGAGAPNFQCASYPRPSGTLVSQFELLGGDGSDRTGVMTVVVPLSNQPLYLYPVCWAAPYPFTTKGGAPASVQGTKPGTTDPLYVGVLPNCATVAPVPPCVQSRTFSSAGASIRVFTTGADPWRYWPTGRGTVTLPGRLGRPTAPSRWSSPI
jgi:hypothetical protein